MMHSVMDRLLPVWGIDPLLLVWATDPVPADKEIKAGWTAFVIFLLLVAATVFLCFSMVKRLKNANAAKAAGAFGDEPTLADSPAEVGAGSSDAEPGRPGESD